MNKTEQNERIKLSTVLLNKYTHTRKHSKSDILYTGSWSGMLKVLTVH